MLLYKFGENNFINLDECIEISLYHNDKYSNISFTFSKNNYKIRSFHSKEEATKEFENIINIRKKDENNYFDIMKTCIDYFFEQWSLIPISSQVKAVSEKPEWKKTTKYISDDFCIDLENVISINKNENEIIFTYDNLLTFSIKCKNIDEEFKKIIQFYSNI